MHLFICVSYTVRETDRIKLLGALKALSKINSVGSIQILTHRFPTRIRLGGVVFTWYVCALENKV